MLARDESTYRIRRIRGATFYTSKRAFDDLTVVVKRFPGPASGGTFVLVHGIGVSSRYFGPTAAALTKYGTVLAIDLPGYGSAPNPRRDVSLADHARVLSEFLRLEDADNPVLVGHSMGCQVVSQLALDSPEVSDRLVLIGATMPPDARSPVKAGWRLFRDILREPFLSNVIVVTDYFFRCGIPYYLRQLPHLLGDRPEDRLPKLTAKTLVINGHKDPVVLRKWAKFWADITPNARLEIVNGPHVVMFTDPERVAELIAGHAQP
jgi:pimeloyl-ACP methyl ester carboxylesterase